ncbi:MAG TPA: EamA family transporter [Terriglobales bacterium]|nr:EamA family transporter [Terriglobales bacterium]
MGNRASSVAYGKSWRGYVYIASAAFCWGISAALGRAAFTGRWLPHALRPIDPLILAQTRTTFAFLLLAPILLASRGYQRLRLPGPEILRMLILGVFGVAASNYFYYLAVQRTTVATAVILQYTAPVWVLLYMVARGLQSPTWQRIMAVTLAIVGIMLVIGIFSAGGFRLDGLGVLAALLAAFSFAFYNVGGHSVLARYDHWMVLLWVTLAASLFWMAVNPPWKIAAAHYAGSQWLFLLVFSVVSVLAPFSFYFAGLQYLEPTRAVIVSCLEPVFSILIAALTLGERVRPLQALGVLLVLAAIVVVQSPDKKSPAAAMVEPIE